MEHKGVNVLEFENTQLTNVVGYKMTLEKDLWNEDCECLTVIMNNNDTYVFYNTNARSLHKRLEYLNKKRH